MEWDDLRGGDVVRDASGVLMTVSDTYAVNGKTRVECVWFDSRWEEQRRSFEREVLTLWNAHQIVVDTGHPVEESVQLHFDEDANSHLSFEDVRSLYRDFEVVNVPCAQYGRARVINHPAFADFLHPWLVLSFMRENRTVAFFSHLTEAVQFKLLTV